MTPASPTLSEVSRQSTLYRAARLTAQLLRAPATLIVLQDGTQVAHGLEALDPISQAALVNELAAQAAGKTILVSDLRHLPHYSSLPAIHAGYRFFAATALSREDGTVFGALIVLDRQVREDLNRSERAVLGEFGSLISDLLSSTLTSPPALVEAIRTAPLELEGAQLSVFGCDAYGQFTFYAGRNLPSFGLDEGVRGHPIEALGARLPGFAEGVQRALNGEHASQRLLLPKGPGGSEGIETGLELHVSPRLDLRGDVIGAVGVILDATERLPRLGGGGAMEVRYQRIFEHAPVPMALVGTDGRLLRHNRSLRQLLGYQDNEPVEGSFLEFPVSGQPNQEWTSFLELVSGKREQYTVEKRLRRKGGQEVPVKASVALIRGEPGETDHLIEVIIEALGRPVTTDALPESEAPIIQAPTAPVEPVPAPSEPARNLETALAEARRQAINDERLRLARELHDGLGKELFGLALLLEGVADRQKGRAVHTELIQYAEAARNLGNQARALLRTFRDPLETALVPHLESLIAKARNEGVPNIEFTHSNVPENLSSRAIFELGRITAEALENVRRHANATQTGVRVASDDITLYLTVTDNGRGLPPEMPQGRYGLIGMRERVELLGGKLGMGPHPGGGTQVSVQVPIQALIEDDGFHVDTEEDRGGST